MGKKKTKEEFIKEATEKHEGKYDYSKVDYVNNRTKVCIICLEHGEFWQLPSSHLKGCGCQKCKGDKLRERCTSTKEEFIKKVKEVHKDKYDYSKVDYVNSKTKVCIICPEPEHGEFWQTPNNHLHGYGCPKCKADKSRENLSLTTEEFITKSKDIHSDNYDYSKVNYVNNRTKVCIICSKHGEFWQTPNSHTQGQGCPKCRNEANGKHCRLSKEEFIKKAKEVHKDKYDYSKVKYEKSNMNICIVCPKHGEFLQEPNSHLRGAGCPKCGIEKVRESLSSSKEEFITKARKQHGDKYDYSEVNYVNCEAKVCIICPEHGEFFQAPSSHLQGNGCPKCNLSHLERSVMNYLDDVGITYDYQKRFDWLGLQSLDFYLSDYNVGIECQGLQHFESVDYFGGDKGFKKISERDKRKFKKCQKNGIKVLYYSNLGIEYPYDVF